MHVFIITGTSQGLGLALKNEFIKKGHFVIGISRSKMKAAENFFPIQMDLSKTSQIKKKLTTRLSAVLKTKKMKQIQGAHLINNAAQLEPISNIISLTAKDIQQAMQINIVAPILLSQIFVQLFRRSPYTKTITNLSSGVAYSPAPGWAVYSLSKSALKSLSQSLQLELPGTFKVLSFGPGLVNTPMQAHIRKSKKKDFPLVDKFIGYHQTNQLQSPESVARKLGTLLLNSDRITKVEYKVDELQDYE